ARPAVGDRRARLLCLRHSGDTGAMRRGVVAVLVILLGGGAEARAATGGSRFTLMMHGWAFLTSNRPGGRSGDQDFESQNHLMLIATRPAGKWARTLLGAVTAEPVTAAPPGSRELVPPRG